MLRTSVHDFKLVELHQAPKINSVSSASSAVITGVLLLFYIYSQFKKFKFRLFIISYKKYWLNSKSK
ncbi:MAG: Hypothetical protein AJITA_00426 [Acetilactobacillus jinshanensis]